MCATQIHSGDTRTYVPVGELATPTMPTGKIGLLICVMNLMLGSSTQDCDTVTLFLESNVLPLGYRTLVNITYHHYHHHHHHHHHYHCFFTQLVFSKSLSMSQVSIGLLLSLFPESSSSFSSFLRVCPIPFHFLRPISIPTGICSVHSLFS